MEEKRKSFTVVLKESLIRQVRIAALQADKNTPQWVEEALTAYLKARKAA
jgi:predicted HicB family RNase H-like nuclease